MPADSRRLPTPEISLDPLLYCQQSDIVLLTDDGLRKDGRGEADLRSLFVKCGLVSEATGSAYCEVGATKVICAVHGPKDIEQKEDFQMVGKIRCEFKFSPFSCKKRKEHIPSSEENELSEILTQTLQSVICLKKFPKSQIELHVNVLDNGGSALALAFMAASLALANASIDTFDIITACTVRVVDKEVFIVDPDEDEEQLSNLSKDVDTLDNGLVTVAVLPSLNQVSALLSSGVMSCDVLSEAMNLCVTSAHSRYMLLRECLTDMIKNSSYDKMVV